MDIITIQNSDHYQELINREDAFLVYFSHEQCNVCKVLKPKISELLGVDFPKIKMYYSDTEKLPEVAGQNSVFTVPTILVYFGGREYIRESRNISVPALAQKISRPYGMMFED